MYLFIIEQCNCALLELKHKLRENIGKRRSENIVLCLSKGLHIKMHETCNIALCHMLWNPHGMTNYPPPLFQHGPTYDLIFSLVRQMNPIYFYIV